MSLTVIVTGSATGIGNLTARALAVAGHTVFASMRDPEGSNAAHARDLRDFASARKAALHVTELDVRSQNLPTPQSQASSKTPAISMSSSITQATWSSAMATSQDDFVARMGFQELLHVKMAAAQR